MRLTCLMIAIRKTKLVCCFTPYVNRVKSLKYHSELSLCHSTCWKSWVKIIKNGKEVHENKELHECRTYFPVFVLIV